MVDVDQVSVYIYAMLARILLLILLFPGPAITLGIPLALYLWAAYRWPNAFDKPTPLNKEVMEAQQSKRLGVLIVAGVIICMIGGVVIFNTDFYELAK
jgi:hypothetical protein